MSECHCPSGTCSTKLKPGSTNPHVVQGPTGSTQHDTNAVSPASAVEALEIIVHSLDTDDGPFFELPNDERPYMAPLLNGVEKTALIDTGSMACVIGYSDISQLGQFKTPIEPTEVVVTTLHQQKRPATGQMEIQYTVDNLTVSLITIIVPARRFQVIAGIPFCKAFGIKLIIDTDYLKQKGSVVHEIASVSAYETDGFEVPKSTEITTQIWLVKPTIRNIIVAESISNTKCNKSDHENNDPSEAKPDSTVASTHMAGPDSVSPVKSEKGRLTPDQLTTAAPAKVNAFLTGLVSTESEDLAADTRRRTVSGNAIQPPNHQAEAVDEGEDTSPESDGEDEYDPVAELMALVLDNIKQSIKRRPGKARRERLREEKRLAREQQAIEVMEIRTAMGPDDTEEDITPEKTKIATQPHELSKEQQARLDEVLNLFPYTPKTGPLNKTPSYIQHIPTGDAQPEMRKQYPLSPYVLEEVKKEIETLRERDIIEPIKTSPWRWPVLWVKKKTGGGRICLDARGLNKLTVPDAYPTLNVDSILRSLRNKAKFITCIDMTQAFHQIEIAPEDRQKVSFAVGNQFYCYKRAVMGCRNSPADLSKLLDGIFHDMQPSVYHYVDDFVIMSETFEEHIETLREVARRLREHNLTISQEKSSFCYKQLAFLGYLLTADGLTVNPEKIRAILDYKRPETVKEVRRLVGLINWYRRFLPNAAEVLAPLTDLIKTYTRGKVKWTPEAEKAFETAKDLLTQEPILATADFSLPFKVYTDASLVAGAAILTQLQDGAERVIAYHSVKFSPTQQNYSATERECLAVLSAVEKFRPWIDGVKFTVVTDHASLKWLQNLKEPHGKLARWAVRLQAFDIEFEHRPGKLMDAPDALSRAVLMIDIKADIETKDAWFKRTRAMAKDGRLDRYKFENGYLYRRGKYDTHAGDRLWTICVPEELVPKVLAEKHDEATHMGYWKTLRAIQGTYYWPNMHREIYHHVTHCDLCRQIKPSNENHRAETGEYRDPEKVGRMLSVDIIGPLPAAKHSKHAYAVVAVDCFSRYVFAKSFVNATADKIIPFLEEEVLFKFDVPEVVITDNGKQFKSKAFGDFVAKYKIRHSTTPLYHAQANMVEATNKKVKTGLKAVILQAKEEQIEWAKHLPRIVMTINTTATTSTSHSPYYIVFGREKSCTGDEHPIIGDANPPIDADPERLGLISDEAAESSKHAFEENKTRYNLRATVRKFHVGDQVYYTAKDLSSKANRFSSKLAPGKKKAIINKALGENTYELRAADGTIIGKYHANMIHMR